MCLTFACLFVSVPAGCADPPENDGDVTYSEDCAGAAEDDVCDFTCGSGLNPLAGTVGPTCVEGEWVAADTDAAQCVGCNDDDECNAPDECDENNECTTPLPPAPPTAP